MNELTTKTSGSGPMEFAGTLNEQAMVTVAGSPAILTNQFKPRNMPPNQSLPPT